VSTTAVVVVYDVSCPQCSRIARELPDLLRVPVTVRSCRDQRLGQAYPTLPPAVRSCARPALGTVRADGSVRWWPGLTGALGVLPVVRPRVLREAFEVLWTALRTSRGR
jgi:hypothetical protein